MAVNIYGKICYDQNMRFQGKVFFSVLIYLLHSIHTFSGDLIPM